VELSGTTWLVSVAAVLISGGLAWLQGNFAKRPGLDMGFANHGGMWGDLLLLPVANAAIVPHLQPGVWIVAAFALTCALSAWVHGHWYRGDPPSRHGIPRTAAAELRQRAHRCEHMWPSRRYGSWWKDLSWAGWAHLVYVAGELTVLVGFLLFPMPDVVIAAVCVIFTLHVPLGLLQPRWFLTGEIASPRKQPLLVPLLGSLWVVGLMKIM
jgi:hypothetical protein